MATRILILGGTGQVGGAVVRALLAQASCTEVVMVNRRKAPLAEDTRLRQVVLDTGAEGFPAEVAQMAQQMGESGDAVAGVSCVGIGAGSASWSEADLIALEVGICGGFARGCRTGGIDRFALLSAVGSSASSRVRYTRIMGMKEDAVKAAGFRRLAIFRPGIIGGNAHTPRYVEWLGRLIPGRFGVIDQDDIGRAFAAEILGRPAGEGVVYLENGAMKGLATLRA